MLELPNTQEEPSSVPAARPRPFSIAAIVTILGLVTFGVFYLMLAMGGASFVYGCNTFLCGQLHQAIFAAVGALAMFIAALRIFTREPFAAKITFFGTLPILVVHVVLVMTDPNESVFFPLSTAPPPAISAVLLVYNAARRGRDVP